MADRPKVGVGVIIHDGKGNVVMGERIGAHGAGTLQLPGGHLEHGESFSTTAIRETYEETRLAIGDVRFLTATNDVFGPEDKGKHYVTIFVTARVVDGRFVAEAMEPTKCAKWEWIPWSQMWAWAGEQDRAEREGREVQRRMFLPLVNLWRDYPELEHVLDGAGMG